MTKKIPTILRLFIRYRCMDVWFEHSGEYPPDAYGECLCYRCRTVYWAMKKYPVSAPEGGFKATKVEVPNATVVRKVKRRWWNLWGLLW